jgi:hypothetical protein
MDARTITIADWLLISVTFIGPIAAVQVQKWIERAKEEKNRKLWIFHTLMATRAVRAGSNEHVQALNLIDLAFRKKPEKNVRDAWALYFDFLAQVAPKEEAQAKAWNEKGVDLLVDLLSAIAITLVLCPGNSLAKSCEFLKNGVGSSRPSERS